MGWTSGYYTRSGLIQERIRDWDWINPENGKRNITKMLAYCLRGNTLWKVMETKFFEKDETEPFKVMKWIGCDLLQRFGKEDWAYKDLDESCGPCQANCPLAYIEMVKDFPPEGYAAAWRERVREYHRFQVEKRLARKSRLAV